MKKIALFLAACLAALLIVFNTAHMNCLAATIGGNGESLQLADGTDVGDIVWIPITFSDGKANLGPFNGQDTIHFALDFNQNHQIGAGDLFSFDSNDAIISSLGKDNQGIVEISWRNSSIYTFQVMPMGKVIEVLYWTYGCPLGLYYGVEKPPEAVPIPAAVYLLGSGLIGLIGFRMKRTF